MPTDDQIAVIFKQFDTSGDGFIDATELKDALVKGGKQVSVEDCKYLLSKVDKNHDSKIDLQEFMALMKLAPDDVPFMLQPIVAVGSSLMSGLANIGKAAADGAVSIGKAVAEASVGKSGKMAYAEDAATAELMRKRPLTDEEAMERANQRSREWAREKARTELEKTFAEFDSDGNGRIDLDELLAALRAGGNSLSRKECEKILKAADINHDNLISFDEFVQVCELANNSMPLGVKQLANVGKLLLSGFGFIKLDASSPSESGQTGKKGSVADVEPAVAPGHMPQVGFDPLVIQDDDGKCALM